MLSKREVAERNVQAEGLINQGAVLCSNCPFNKDGCYAIDGCATREAICYNFCKAWLDDNPEGVCNELNQLAIELASFADTDGGEEDATVAQDMVNHPAHYTAGNIEVIDFIEDQQLPYHLGNAVKYISRCRHKGKEKEDIKKSNLVP